MKHAFKIGDKVYASDWCYGTIIDIDYAQNLIMVENCIGTEFKQKIWVSSKNSKQALNLSRFIICQMHL